MDIGFLLLSTRFYPLIYLQNILMQDYRDEYEPVTARLLKNLSYSKCYFKIGCFDIQQESIETYETVFTFCNFV